VADTPSTDGASPWGQRGFVLAAVFMGVLVLAGLGLLLTDTDADPAASAGGGTPSVVESAKGSKPAASDSRCGLAAGDQRVPATPPEAGWELVDGVASPQSDVIGPGIREGHRRLCYAHSPTGALFAAANFLSVAGAENDDDQLVKDLTAKTAARDEMLAEADSGAAEEDRPFQVQIAGFRVGPVTPDEATVEIVIAASAQAQQGFVGYTLPMRWEDGDWKLVITSTTAPYTVQRLDSASGFVPWGAT
jgi:hypothetical protein